MQRGIYPLLVLAIFMSFPVFTAEAAAPESVVISQLQTGGSGTGHANDEFIELYNPTALPRGLDHWVVQYRSGTAAGDCTQSWTTKLTLTGALAIIQPFSYFLVAASGYLAQSDAQFSPGLASTKGAIRLLGVDGETVDAVAWGDAPCGEGTAADAPAGGQSLERRTGSAESGYSNSFDSANNKADFAIQSLPTPRSRTSPAAIPYILETLVPDPVVYPRLEVTEVYATPSAPAQAGDAFIELHNPSDQPLQVAGYAIVSGGQAYHLLPYLLPADGYVAIASSLSRLSFSLSGDVAVTDPTGEIVDDGTTWTDSPAGQSWMRSGNDWAWTATPTAGFPNELTAPTLPNPVPAIGPVAMTVAITEVIPNPTTALNGGLEKFVELHNYGSAEVSLDDYSLRSGMSWGNHLSLTGLRLAPGEYRALPYSRYKLSLATSGGQVGLFDSLGGIVGQAVTYGKAPPGESYSLIGATWEWTGMPTPGTPNIAAAPIAPMQSAKKSAKVSAPKTAAARKATATRAAARPASSGFGLASAQAGNASWLLFVLAGLTMAYVSYEFRHDIQLYLYRRLGHHRPGRADRESAARPDDARTDE